MEDVDTFLGGNECESQVWEPTQTSEMLCRLQAFQGILVATTSQYELLDRMLLRAFDYKVALRALDRHQFAMLLDQVAGTPGETHAINSSSGSTYHFTWTPGDVWLALRGLELAGQPINRAMLEAELQAEAQHQSVGPARIGFMAGFSPKPMRRSS